MAMVPPAWLKYFGANLLEFFLPRMCLFCGVPVGETAAVAVCPDCEAQIEWVASPMCTCCGWVFESRDGADRVCGDCQAEPPPFSRARAAVIYAGPVGDTLKKRPVLMAITGLKFSRQMAFLPVMQHWLQQPLCLELVAAADLLAPVPLHPKRIKDRGFNQSLLLARTFSGPVVSRDAVIRTRHTTPQVGLNPKERRDNVKGAFAVPDPARVQDKSVLLIDDLYTTGSTVKECARVLLKAGARRVEVLTVARVKHK
jgi:ComF family protein